MDKEIIDRIIGNISTRLEQKQCPVSVEKFRKIEARRSEKKITFIDGGQAELIRAVDVSLQFIRVAGVTFRKRKKKKTRISEFFILINAAEKEGDIRFETEIFPLKGDAIENINMNSLEPSIKKGKERAEISDIGNIIRRFSELDMARKIAEEEKGSIIVIDGNLREVVKGEDEYLSRLFDAGIENDTVITSLAKTSRLFIGKGSCLLSSLNEKGSDEYPWHYDFGERAIVKLYKSSEYVFEFNICEKQKHNMDEILGILAGYSNDSVFPGYPYGLLVVDQIARVSNNEKEFLIILLESRAGKGWKRLKTAVNALNSHDKLDNIS